MHAVLTESGFTRLESSTRTYGNGKFTGSIAWVTPKGAVVHENDVKDTVTVFLPFISPEKYGKDKYESIRLVTKEDLETFAASFELTGKLA